MNDDTDLVSAALSDCEALAAWRLPAWERLVREARQADLLSRLAVEIEARGLLHAVPPAPRAHLEGARVLARAHAEDIRREVAYVRRAVASIGVDIVLLKGAAYLMAGLPPAAGRLFSDVDILVPRAALPVVESSLMLHGWTTTHHHPHDQRYYREWAHELPPMQHTKRLTVLDVHHTILPLTARRRPDAARLLAASVPVPGEPGLRVLAPADMIIHSATHLFYNEEFSHGLRDLYDLHCLLTHFADGDAFWRALAERAAELDLLRPLYYALRHARGLLNTQVPPEALTAAAGGAPRAPLAGLMDALWRRVLRAPDVQTGDPRMALAQAALYLRAHWLRMPPLLLAYHLTAKALRRKDSS